jgi:hypothetical protein
MSVGRSLATNRAPDPPIRPSPSIINSTSSRSSRGRESPTSPPSFLSATDHGTFTVTIDGLSQHFPWRGQNRIHFGKAPMNRRALASVMDGHRTR